MASLAIRKATPADADIVIEFNRLLAEESEGKALDRATLAAGVKQVLGDANKGVYFLAEEAGGVIGQTCITFEFSDWRNGWFWWIQSVYVRPEARRRGVFRSLYEHIQKAAQADPEVIGLRLYVEGDNHRAHQTYYGLGMEKTGYFVLEKYPL